MSELLDDLFGEGFTAGRPRLVPGERWIADHPDGPFRRDDGSLPPYTGYWPVERVERKDGCTTIIVGPLVPRKEPRR